MEVEVLPLPTPSQFASEYESRFEEVPFLANIFLGRGRERRVSKVKTISTAVTGESCFVNIDGRVTEKQPLTEIPGRDARRSIA